MKKNSKPNFKFNYIFDNSDRVVDMKKVIEQLFKKFLIEYNK